MLLALRFRRRQRFALEREQSAGVSKNSVQIQTSPYTQSELTL